MEHTDDGFARALVFYRRCRSTMLTQKNLLRIVAKYRNNPDIMLSDLQGRLFNTHKLSFA